MAIFTTDFIDQLRGPWDSASGFLIDQLTLMQAQLAPIFPLITGIQSTVNTLNANAIIGLSGYPVSSVLATDAAGTPGFASLLPMPVAFASATEITPAALTVNTNDYAPTGLAAAAILRIAATGAVNLTGLLAASTRTMKLVYNVGAFTITFTHADAASVAANRFRCPGAANKALTQGSAFWIAYDVTSAVWQVVAP